MRTRSLPLALLGLGLWALAEAGTVSPHPTGTIAADAAKRIGSPDLAVVECLDCHVGHGARDALLLEGRDSASSVCLSCHKALDVRSHSGTHPMQVAVESPDARARLRELGGVLGSGNKLVCGSCHTAHASADISRRCIACHPGEAPLASALPGEKGHRSGVCLDCHNPHPGAGNAPVAGKALEGDPLSCLRCHGEGAKHQPVDARPGALGHAIVDAEGGFGPSDPPFEGCPSCHTDHQMNRPDSRLCVECHDAQGEDDARGGHGTATCIDCHPPHEAQPMHENAPDGHYNPMTRRCLACHAEDSPGEASVPRVESFEHPAPVFLPDGQRWSPATGDIPLFDPTGRPQPAGVNGELSCASCHLSHGPDINKPGDSLRRAGWQPACTACHGENGLMYYRWFHYRDRVEHLHGPEMWKPLNQPE